MEYLPLLLGITLIDYLPLLILKLSRRKPISLSSAKNNDYTILVSVFHNPIYLKDLEKLAKYKQQVLILTTTRETEEFYETLNSYCNRYGFKSVRLNFGKDFVVPESCIPLFVKGIRHVKTKYLIRMDADSIPERDLGYLFATLDENELDVASVRVLPLPEHENGSLIEKLQCVEYKTSMDTRTLFPYLTSGAAIIGKTNFLKKVVKNHSGFFNGEDIEIGKLSKRLKGKIGNVNFIVYTEIPKTYKKWFRQRTNWMMGGFRHSIMNFWTNSPWHIFYYSVVVYGLLPLRIFYSIRHFYLLPIVYSIYVFMNFIFRYREFEMYYLLFPLYAFVQSTVIPSISVYKYFRRVIKLKSFGWIKLREPSLSV